MSSALIVQADVHYRAKEVEPIHNAHHLATVGDDGARDPLARHLVGGNDLTATYQLQAPFAGSVRIEPEAFEEVLNDTQRQQRE